MFGSQRPKNKKRIREKDRDKNNPIITIIRSNHHQSTKTARKEIIVNLGLPM